jgi:hypothetical protein
MRLLDEAFTWLVAKRGISRNAVIQCTAVPDYDNKIGKQRACEMFLSEVISLSKSDACLLKYSKLRTPPND